MTRLRPARAAVLAVTLLAPLACGPAPRPAPAAPMARPATAPADPEAGVRFFESRIRPVLVAECYDCHRTKSAFSMIEGGLWVDSLAALQTGGQSGEPAVVPGDPAKGTLLPALRYAYTGKAAGRNMPPKRGKDDATGGKLTDQTIADFEHWVRIGAPVTADFHERPKTPSGL